MVEKTMNFEQSDRKDMPGENSRPISKVCEAADFFSPEYINVLKGELKAIPVMHRKQWESAMILLALKKRGMLDGSKVGLSMGSGNEVVLYSIAQHVKHLTATDLYSSESLWECAKASNPDEYIRKSKPFPVDDAKLSALHMDMRNLTFEDNTFDFAYSSCAFEHIGEDAHFLKHLNEVYRVLIDGGIYVMTTEFTFESYAAMSGDEEKNYAAIRQWSDQTRGLEELNVPVEALSRISPMYFFENISAAISIHHGQADELVPLSWSSHHL